MNILLIDVDSKIPNLALMKLSTYHKSLNDRIEICKVGLNGYPRKRKQKIINADGFDLVYISTIFTVNSSSVRVINCENVIVGGSGVSLSTVLPSYVDELEEDYSIYPDNDVSYGFITRGCIRNCSFCFVPKKEGKLSFYRDWRKIVHHDAVHFLDNNILAYKDHKRILQELAEARIKCQFNQGLDIRLLDEENSYWLSKINYLREYIFAFDNINYEKVITNKLALFKKYVPSDWREKFFIYCNAEMEISDVLYRINWCSKNKVLPYVMRDKNCWNSYNKNFYVDIAAWCNQPGLYKNMNFQTFVTKRYNNSVRSKLNIDLWNKHCNN